MAWSHRGVPFGTTARYHRWDDRVSFDHGSGERELEDGSLRRASTPWQPPRLPPTGDPAVDLIRASPYITTTAGDWGRDRANDKRTEAGRPPPYEPPLAGVQMHTSPGASNNPRLGEAASAVSDAIGLGSSVLWPMSGALGAANNAVRLGENVARLLRPREAQQSGPAPIVQDPNARRGWTRGVPTPPSA